MYTYDVLQHHTTLPYFYTFKLLTASLTSRERKCHHHSVCLWLKTSAMSDVENTLFFHFNSPASVFGRYMFQTVWHNTTVKCHCDTKVNNMWSSGPEVITWGEHNITHRHTHVHTQNLFHSEPTTQLIPLNPVQSDTVVFSAASFSGTAEGKSPESGQERRGRVQ